MNNNPFSHRTILGSEQVEKMSEVAENPRNSLIPALMYELGIRCVEAKSLDRSDLTNKGDHWEISINDPLTGQRTLILVEYTSELEAWLNQHPHSGEDFPLLVNRNGERISHRELNQIIKKLGTDAKKCSNNLFGNDFDPQSLTLQDFRVSCAKKKCEKPLNFSMNQLEHWFGWTHASQTSEKYYEEFNGYIPVSKSQGGS